MCNRARQQSDLRSSRLHFIALKTEEKSIVHIQEQRGLLRFLRGVSCTPTECYFLYNIWSTLSWQTNHINSYDCEIYVQVIHNIFSIKFQSSWSYLVLFCSIIFSKVSVHRIHPWLYQNKRNLLYKLGGIILEFISFTHFCMCEVVHCKEKSRDTRVRKAWV